MAFLKDFKFKKKSFITCLTDPTRQEVKFQPTILKVTLAGFSFACFKTRLGRKPTKFIFSHYFSVLSFCSNKSVFVGPLPFFRTYLFFFATMILPLKQSTFYVLIRSWTLEKSIFLDNIILKIALKFFNFPKKNLVWML